MIKKRKDDSLDSTEPFLVETAAALFVLVFEFVAFAFEELSQRFLWIVFVIFFSLLHRFEVELLPTRSLLPALVVLAVI